MYGRKFENIFLFAFQNIAKDVHQNAINKKWWEEERNDGELIALMHSELSEALEGLRHGDPASDKIPEFTSSEEELADVIIRIMDYGCARNLKIAEALIAKMKYNEGCTERHGGKLF